MILLTGKVRGEVQLFRALTRIVSASEDLSKPFEEVGQEFRDIMDERFQHEGFGEWPPLAPSTVLRKLKLYGRSLILRATDKLYRSLTIKDAEGNVTEIFPLHAAFGTSIFYAPFHQYGTSRMPARKIIALHDDQRQRIVRTVQRYMIASGQQAGFQIIAP